MDIETMVFISVDVYEWKKHLAHLMTFSDRTKNLSYLTKCYRSERKKRTFLIIGCFHFVFLHVIIIYLWFIFKYVIDCFKTVACK